MIILVHLRLNLLKYIHYSWKNIKLRILYWCFVDGQASSADEESSSQEEMTIHLPGAPVTADLQMDGQEQMDEDENLSEDAMFHGFTPEEIDQQAKKARFQR